MIRGAAVIIALVFALTASAQRPLFDPDDFLDPRATGGRPVLISRIIIGAASNMTGDGFRPLAENIGYLHLATSFSWRSLQFDYKRTQLKAADGASAVWVYPVVRLEADQVNQPSPFAARQSREGTPQSKDTLNAAWYWPVPTGGGIPVMLRSRVTYAAQPIATEIIRANRQTQHMYGRERTLAVDTDTWFRFAGHEVFGSLAFSETKTRTNTTDRLGDRNERALTYINRFPSFSFDRPRILLRPTLTVGGISNRAGSAVNLISPAIEFFRPFPRTGVNLHVIYGPQWSSDGERWRTTHQVALLIDRALFVKVFGEPTVSSEHRQD